MYCEVRYLFHVVGLGELGREAMVKETETGRVTRTVGTSFLLLTVSRPRAIGTIHGRLYKDAS